MQLRDYIKQQDIEALFYHNTFGIEKEGLRVQTDGQVASSKHPSLFGSRTSHPYIQTDFAESQLELITPPMPSTHEAFRWLTAIHEVVLRSLKKDEYLWPLSIHTNLPAQEDIEIAQLKDQKEVDYRNYLAQKYGKTKQLMSGIHYNFQINSTVIEHLATSIKQDPKEVNNQIYFNLAKSFLTYEWILTYLFAATPFEASGNNFEKLVRSIRNSQKGYVNHKEVEISLESLPKFVESLEEMVSKGILLLEKELYSSVRFRGQESARKLLEEGIGYLEFRGFDLNPYAPYGILEKDLKFVHLFVLNLLWTSENLSQDQVIIGKAKKEKVALSSPDQSLKDLGYLNDALGFLDQMTNMVKQLKSPYEENWLELIEEKRQELLDPKKTIVYKMLEEINRSSYADLGLRLAKKYQELAMKEEFALKGFTNLELSTQILFFDAIQKGIKVGLLDESDQFLQLDYAGRREFVKNGNMTSKDSVSSMLAMENKVVTKKILKEAGFHVPNGQEIKNQEEARLYWQTYAGQPLVIKPKSTNYGLGITIFKVVPELADFEEAVRLAFLEDDRVLIEEFVAGTEYRFFVIYGQTKAVLLRKPANVIGDGKHTIEELVIEKNKHPYRGLGHQYPLTKIVLGEIELLNLKQEGYGAQSIPDKGQTVYLRENSNISTGGDSIDVTKQMHPSYKAIAGQAVQALQASISGIDLLIPDLSKATDIEQVQDYAIIEANFNPAMMMQVYPQEGEGRRLTMDVLEKLFPEIKK